MTRSIRSIRRWLVQGFIVRARVRGQWWRIVAVHAERGRLVGEQKDGRRFRFSRVQKGAWDNT